MANLLYKNKVNSLGVVTSDAKNFSRLKYMIDLIRASISMKKTIIATKHQDGTTLFLSRKPTAKIIPTVIPKNVTGSKKNAKMFFIVSSP